MALISQKANHFLADLDADMVSPPIKDGNTVYSFQSQTLYICDAGQFVPAAPSITNADTVSIRKHVSLRL